MKKFLTLLLSVTLLLLALTACGGKSVERITITEGLAYEYEIGQTPDYSAVKATITYNDESTKVVTVADGLTLSTPDTSTAGKKTITVSYDGFSTTVEITVVAPVAVPTVAGLTIDAATVATKVKVGEAYSTDSIRVKATYTDGTTRTLTAQDLTITSPDTTEAGTSSLIVSFGGKSTSAEVTVVGVSAMAVDSASVAGEVKVGEEHSTEGIRVNVTYTDGTTEVVSGDALTVTGISTAEAGVKTLSVSYLDGGCTYSVTVHGISHISVDADSVNTVVQAGDEIDISEMIVYAHYTDGDKVTVDPAEVTTNIDDIDINSEEDKTLVVYYAGLSTEVIISATAPDLLSISITKYAQKIPVTRVYDTSAITVTATYSNNTQKPLDLSDVSISEIDTSTAGEKTLTVSYGGMTDTKTVTVLAVQSVSVNTATVASKVEKGGVYDVSALEVIVLYSDGTTSETLKAGDAALTVSTVDTSKVGDTTLTVTYLGVSGTHAVHVRGVVSLSLVAGSISTTTTLGATYSADGVLVDAYYSDGTFAEGIGLSSGLALAGEIDTSVGGVQYLTVSYEGATLEIGVTVDLVELYGVTLPDSLVNLSTYKENYRDAGAAYVVGDDNPYVFTLQLIMLDENDNTITKNISYLSASLVYLVADDGSESLAGEEYVVIDETKNSFDFTEAAIGKTFKIVTRPASGYDASEIDGMTRTHTVTVVDGYNIYNPKELNLITNYNDDFDGDGDDDQLAVVNSFLANNGIVRPSVLSGVVLHGNITLGTTDLPSEYFYTYTDGTGAVKSEFYDYLSVFYHQTTEAEPVFTIHGNYYSLYTYDLPCVVASGYANQDDEFSNSQLFRFTIDDALKTSSLDYTRYGMNVQNLSLRDDDPNSDDQSASERYMRGLIGIKSGSQITNVTNTNIEAYFISFLAEGDFQTVNLHKVKFYNAWQGHLFLWSTNMYQDDDETPWSNYSPLEVNITDSLLAKCGGPVILSQTAEPDAACNALSGADVVIDEASTLYSYVTGEEAWFVAMKVNPLAQQIKAMSSLLSMSATAQGYTAGYTTTEQVAGQVMMNLVMVNMTVGGDPLAGLDVDGTLTMGGTTVMNQNDGENVAVETYTAVTKQMTGQDVPVFQSSAGGTCFCDGETGVYGIDLAAGSAAAADASCFSGEYITLYYCGMAVVLEYNP